MRKLTEKEIFLLEDQGCLADDWTNINVTNDNFRTTNIFNVRFYGTIELGGMNGRMEIEEGFSVRCGIHNATLHNVTVGDDCLIENVGGCISNYEIGNNVFVSNVGTITTKGVPNFAIGNTLAVLNEAGDGNVVLYDRLTAQVAQLMIRDKAVYDMILKEQKSRPKAERGQIGNGCRIMGAREICNVMIGECCEIQGASQIADCTIVSNGDAPVFIGPDVIMENSIATYGASIANGAKIDNSFIGESVHVGKGYSAETTVMFANTYLDNGESCAAFLGPFSCSHHKASLLIAGQFSFYNAGSSTNQSNHAYKMGPIHYGTLERGGKTASGAHIIWPAHFGPFTMVMGKIENHPNLMDLPFSYVIGKNKTCVVPGINIRTVGTWRDVNKWPRRDMRPKTTQCDIINFEFPNPFIIQHVINGKKILQKLLEESKEDTLEYEGCLIRRSAAIRGIEYYDMAIGLFTYQVMQHTYDDNEANEVGNDEWIDLAGMVLPKRELDRILEDIAHGRITSSAELQLILSQINDDYRDNEASYARAIMQKEGQNMFVNTDEWLARAEKAHKLWIKLVKDDAEKEYQLGDVDIDFLREFLEKI